MTHATLIAGLTNPNIPVSRSDLAEVEAAAQLRAQQLLVLGLLAFASARPTFDVKRINLLKQYLEGITVRR